ncbi:MAG: ClpX C4-type zinc finger protein [Acidimicrobiales bacterium]
MAAIPELAAKARRLVVALTDDDDLPCWFCGKARAEVRWLVAAESGVRICDECVDYAAEMIDEQRRAQK